MQSQFITVIGKGIFDSFRIIKLFQAFQQALIDSII
jgi:hypothetical protein